MDYSLVQIMKISVKGGGNVLILVVMDYSLVLGASIEVSRTFHVS